MGARGAPQFGKDVGKEESLVEDGGGVRNHLCRVGTCGKACRSSRRSSDMSDDSLCNNLL